MPASIQYDVLGVFVGPPVVSGNVPSGEIHQLKRVQSSNYSIELQRENVVGLGTARVNDKNLLTPFVNLSIDYNVTDGHNERYLGFVVDGIHGSLTRLNSGERDFFMLVNKPSDPMVLGIGNGVLTKYSVSARVNDTLKANVGIRGYNMQVDADTSGNYLPRIDRIGVPEDTYTYTLPPLLKFDDERTAGQIENNIFVGPRHIHMMIPSGLTFATKTSGSSSSHLQEFNFSLDLNRDEMTKIGEKYPIKRCLTLPIELTLSATMILNNYQADKIQNYFCSEERDITIDIKTDTCETYNDFWEEEESTTKLRYTFRGMKLRSFSSEASVGDRKTVTFQWSVQIGNLQDLERNLYMSGDFGEYQFLTQGLAEQTGEDNLTELIYKRTKVEVEQADHTVSFRSTIQEPTGNPSYYQYYDGWTSLAEQSGDFGSGTTRSVFNFNSDSYSTVSGDKLDEGLTEHFGTFLAKHPIGYPGLFDQWSGENPFYLKGTAVYDEPITIDFGDMPPWLNGAAGISTFQIDRNKPYFFNTANFSVSQWNFPTGIEAEIKMITRTDSLKKVYGLTVVTGPYNPFPVTLPKTFSRRATMFFQPYDERTVTYNIDDEISAVQNTTLVGQTFQAISGTPIYSLNQLNGNSYVTLNDGAFFRYTGNWDHDFRNFTCFAVFRPTSASSANASLFKFYNTDTSKVYYNNLAFCGRSGTSQTTNFYYQNPTVATGYTTTGPIPAFNTWIDDQWNIASFMFDGVSGSGFNSGIASGSSAFTVSASGYFNVVEIGNGFRGDIADIIIIPYKLLPVERYHILELLKYKWNFS